MTPSYYSSFSPFPIDLNEDQPQEHFSLQHVTEATSSSSSLLLYPNFIYQHGEGGGYFERESGSLKLEEEANDKRLSHGGSLDHATLKNEENGNVLKFSLSKKEYKEENHSDTSSSIKWMSSKMRLMKKMMRPDQTIPNTSETTIRKFGDNKERSLPSNADNNSNNNTSNSSSNAVRVCSDCNTTKTPLWRSGPRGPKSLCNACGIRQRKARRAMAAAGANGTVFTTKQSTAKTKVQHKEKKTNNSHLPLKKRCKFTAQSGGSKKLCFEDLSIIFSKNSAFHGVFPQDEKEAAILLMALSQGLVRG
ncbi:hypothetical protein K2173_016006 [Erythroxylum novogranatense]|uniref:GATA-type domain-containing protein n=1 Tax=Erythroxylum novogranatense TaxID=1862640 RepID=A0AAV8SFW7_9ROSI|nr:hypothetical protein K2173_016006 [Erythroxylum novogranatense]